MGEHCEGRHLPARPTPLPQQMRALRACLHTPHESLRRAQQQNGLTGERDGPVGGRKWGPQKGGGPGPSDEITFSSTVRFSDPSVPAQQYSVVEPTHPQQTCMSALSLRTEAHLSVCSRALVLERRCARAGRAALLPWVRRLPSFVASTCSEALRRAVTEQCIGALLLILSRGFNNAQCIAITLTPSSSRPHGAAVLHHCNRILPCLIHLLIALHARHIMRIESEMIAVGHRQWVAHATAAAMSTILALTFL